MWIKELSEGLGLERLTYISKVKWKDLFQLWEPNMNIMKGGNIGIIWSEIQKIVR